ncbi:MAG: hypothetical protein K2X51_16825 [Burkholderiales bacterium]|nr:hypothetical protein [Burkholderiales bacterium]
MDVEFLKVLANRVRLLLAQQQIAISRGQALDLAAALPGRRIWPEVQAFSSELGPIQLDLAAARRLSKRLLDKHSQRWEPTLLLRALSGETFADQLPDPVRGVNRTPVYLRAEICLELRNSLDAIRFLRNLPQPIELRRISNEGMTVQLLASQNPRIVLMRSVPRARAADDVQEIRDVLAHQGVKTVIAEAVQSEREAEPIED